MLLDAEIRNGRLHLLPFDTKFGPDNLVNVSGSNGVDGTIDYIMKMNVPSGELGKAASGAISNALGAPVTSDRAKFDLLIGGLMDDPSVKMGKPNAADMGKELIGNILGNKKNEGKTTVTNAVNDKVDDQKAVLKAKADGIMATAQKQADGVKSNAKKAAAKVKSEGYANATKLENSSKNPIVKKANKITAAKMRKETDKKSAKIISEGNKKADGVMAAARNKVAALK